MVRVQCFGLRVCYMGLSLVCEDASAASAVFVVCWKGPDGYVQEPPQTLNFFNPINPKAPSNPRSLNF